MFNFSLFVKWVYIFPSNDWYITMTQGLKTLQLRDQISTVLTPLVKDRKITGKEKNKLRKTLFVNLFCSEIRKVYVSILLLTLTLRIYHKN